MSVGLPATACLVGLTLALPARAAHEVPAFERLENPTGPSHNSIFDITQDRRGFLWIGTQDGLNRFDGYTFKVYRHDRREPASISANRVNAVLEDSASRIWVGTAAGIDRLDRASQTFTRYAIPGAGDTGAAALDLFEGPSGTVWAGTGVGVLRYDAENDVWVPAIAEPPRAPVRRVRATAAGDLWLIVDHARPRSNELWRVALDGGIEDHPIGEGLGLDLDGEGRPWIGVAGPGRVDADASRVGGRWVTDVLVDAAGTVWAGGETGIGIRRPAEEPTFQSVVEGPEILSNHVAVAFRDRSDILWLGTENGLYVHDPHRKAFRHHAKRPTQGASSMGPPVAALAETSSGELWVGAYEEGGLYRLERDGSRLSLIRSPLALPDRQVWSLQAEGDRLLVGTSGPLCEIPIGGDGMRCEEPGIGVGARGLAVDARDRVWRPGPASILGEDGAGGWKTFRYELAGDLPDEDEVAQLLADGDSLWVATWSGPLKRFDLTTETFQRIPRIDEEGWEQMSPVLDLLRAADGTLWLGTGDGLSAYDPRTGRFRHLAHRDGLPGGNVYSILEDRWGRLWLGTNRGLARFDPGAGGGGRFRRYGKADGVVNIEFNRHAKLETSDGRFLLGGLSGITEFRPEAIEDNPVAPPVSLLGVEVLGEDGPRQLQPYGLGSVTLRPGDSAVTVEYVALGFTDTASNRYAYRLEGLEERWIDAGSERVARYTSLPAGEYVFRVKAANNDGVWNEEGAALPIRVLPPYWRTWWFRATAVAALIAALAFAYRLRVRRLIGLERMRLRIAGDLHDELGSDLAGIALATARVAGREYLDQPDRESLRDVRAASVRVLEGLRDIVWYVNPDHDNLRSTEARMRSVASTLLADVDDVRLEFALPDDDRALDMATRRNVYLIYKELLANVARHAGATRVGVRMEADEAGIVLVVSDDGIGFDPEGDTGGSGLRNLRRRAAALGATFDIGPGPSGGTRARLHLARSKRRRPLGRKRRSA